MLIWLPPPAAVASDETLRLWVMTPLKSKNPPPGSMDTLFVAIMVPAVRLMP